VALQDDIRIIRGAEEGPHMFTVNVRRITSHADLAQNVVLANNDIVYVPRSFMGDVNHFSSKCVFRHQKFPCQKRVLWLSLLPQ